MDDGRSGGADYRKASIRLSTNGTSVFILSSAGFLMGNRRL
jgi:hypothetical protein